MRHVVVMTSTAAIGLIAVFFVDAISLFYISLLGDPAQTAAVGRASYALGFVIGVSVGMMIGASVVVSRAIGAGRDEAARSYVGSSLLLVFLFNTFITIILLLGRDWMLEQLQAEGDALAYAQTYLNIILPATPFLGVGLVATGLLRANGDARRAMIVTLAGGILTAILDPLFIFGFGLEVTGAAIVSATIRVGMAVMGLYYLIRVHAILALPSPQRFLTDAGDILKFSLPAALTNLAPHVGVFFIALKVAEFGDLALAGQAVTDRLIPVSFGVIFALSGAVGPIIGQNFGAGLMDRVRRTLIDGIVFNVIYVTFAWGLLYLLRNQIIATYSATGDMALVIDLFCTFVAGSFLFNGILFVTNAAFNNLGKPLWATLFNWGRQTLGIIPFVWIGADIAGLPGISIGWSLGAIPFALGALFTAFWLIKVTPAEAGVIGAPQTAGE